MNKKLMIPGISLIVLLGVAYAADRLDFPGDFAGPPLYGGLLDSPTQGLAAYAFYREPESIPADANLDGVALAARSYPLTVHGFVIRSAPPPARPDVLHVEDDPGMPIWLLSSEDVNDALADGVLQIGELENAASLVKGTADNYVLNQSVKDPNSYTIDAHGKLEDGRTFRLQLVWQDGEVKTKDIVIK